MLKIIQKSVWIFHHRLNLYIFRKCVFPFFGIFPLGAFSFEIALPHADHTFSQSVRHSTAEHRPGRVTTNQLNALGGGSRLCCLATEMEVPQSLVVLLSNWEKCCSRTQWMMMRRNGGCRCPELLSFIEDNQLAIIILYINDINEQYRISRVWSVVNKSPIHKIW